ncbi:DNA topoisomerase type I [Fowlpox virus]|uniref:DNA topoisomerase n=2 Tax=Fowlpox virus TaxID=10261 RepID=Q9J587_FOWPN|nr:DNA topoisomerase type I [Fowlpox virus]UNS14359.1 ALPV-195 [Albatrosspox virus]WPD90850.1 DNA topoisomerase type I [Avipoxvirus sp.]CAE52682.1 H6R DNA topoisomerase orthologue [Fowlpox virus isolate HP-438/Munich]AAF44487.1 ORF FPV143 DNA topoisomerase [Fowlpox virus]ART91576.1 H6R DNA topoisomerase ortholog [Fowlpox virus]
MVKKVFFHYKDDKLYYDAAYKNLVPASNKTYEIIKAYRVPPHLKEVIVYEQSLEEASNSLIFIGVDSKGRKQYFYGKNHVILRNKNRDKVFIKVHKIIKKINNYIDKNICSESNTLEFQLAVFMLMETSFYIRIGKVKYYKQNDTVGLLTLQNKHLTVTDENITIKFTGKDKVVHAFNVKKENRLYEPLLRIHDFSKPDSVLFSLLSEKKVYSFIKQYSIKIKDLRTYGVNITFLYNIWNNVISMLKLPSIKKLIVLSIKQTADTIGHTPNISKQAYMAITILELMKEENITETIKQKTFDEFLNFVINYVNKKKI